MGKRKQMKTPQRLIYCAELFMLETLVTRLLRVCFIIYFIHLVLEPLRRFVSSMAKVSVLSDTATIQKLPWQFSWVMVALYLANQSSVHGATSQRPLVHPQRLCHRLLLPA